MEYNKYMTTETSLTILVIILSVTLAVALILAIVLLVKLVQIAKILKRITLKAEDIADKAEAAAEFFEKGASTLSLTRLIANITDMVSRKHK